MTETLVLLGFGVDGWGGLLLAATGTTLLVSLSALALAAVLGGVAAAAKLSPIAWHRRAGTSYTTLMRAVPELLIIYLVYFGGSALVTWIADTLGAEGFAGLPGFAVGTVAVGAISGAYLTEVFRAAFLGIVPGEIEAARAFGMPAWQRFRRIIAPQVLSRALPGVANVWQLTLKDSALVSITGLPELMRTAETAAGSTRSYLVFYAAAGGLYLGLTALSELLSTVVEHRWTQRVPANRAAAHQARDSPR